MWFVSEAGLWVVLCCCCTDMNDIGSSFSLEHWLKLVFFADWLGQEFFLCSSSTERNPSADVNGPLCLSVWTAGYCNINDPPLNGGVINRTKLRPGSRLLYYCNRGYRLVGSSNATCRLYPNGLFQWDTPPPLCQGKNFRLVGNILVFRKEELKDFSQLISARMEKLTDRYDAEPGHC